MGWIFGENWQRDARLDGKTAVITGSNTGVGYFTALDFYKRGCKVILACRSKEKAKNAAESIQKYCKGQENIGELDVVELDLSSMRSVRSCANQLLLHESNIHYLINNAGLVSVQRCVSEDGYECQWATNHLGHFLLTLLLLPRLIRSAPARILNLTSEPHCIANGIDFDDINSEESYFYHTAYSQTKLANILFTNELARRLKLAEVRDVTVYSVNPGAVDTQLSEEFAGMILPGVRWFYSWLKRFFMQSGQQGAQTTIYCTVAQEAAQQSGYYYSDCRVAEPPTACKSHSMAFTLWDVSLKMTYWDKFNYMNNPFIAG